MAIKLGTDPRRSDQQVLHLLTADTLCPSEDGLSASRAQVRGATTLPHGTGKCVRVCVFAEGEGAQAARDAGALPALAFAHICASA